MGAALPTCTKCCHETAFPGDMMEPDREALPNLTSNVPLLLHFDVNKTVLLSDSLIMKSIEEGVREGIAELFWGWETEEDGKQAWRWTWMRPSVNPPAEALANPEGRLVTYYQHCKEVIKDKDERKKAIRSFSLVVSPNVKSEMEKWVTHALKKMELPRDFASSPAAKGAGLKGTTHVMLPAVFHLVAALHRQGRKFAIVFRSFGDDHEKIRTEWNAFCEMRHPIFSSLLQGIGPLDGSSPGLPDRRIKNIHTLYRDAQGPVLILDTFTNGPSDASWDSWAKSKPKPKADLRGGRPYIKETLKASTVEGILEMQQWLHNILNTQATSAIKDDWAWWQFNGETSKAGKLMPLMGSTSTTHSIFFDDNVELDDPRIVDCRYPDSTEVPVQRALNKLCVKVNPVEALLDEGYFLRKLVSTEAEGAGLFDTTFSGRSLSLKALICCEHKQEESNGQLDKS